MNSPSMIFVICFFIFVSGFAEAQDSTVKGVDRPTWYENVEKKRADLKSEAEKASNPITKINKLNELCTDLVFSYPDSAVVLARQALKLAEKNNYKTGIADAKMNLGIYENMKGMREKNRQRYEKALEIHTEVLEIYKDMSAQERMAAQLIKVGNTYRMQDKMDKSIEYYDKAIKLSREINDRHSLSEALFRKARIFISQRKPKEAERYLDQAAEIAVKYAFFDLILWIFPEKIDLYTENQDTDKLIDTYNTYFKYLVKYNHSESQIYNTNKIGFFLSKTGQYKEALKYHEKALEIAENFGLEQYQINTLSLLGTKYAELNNYEEAIRLLNKAIVFKNILPSQEVSAYKQLSWIYNNLAEYPKALEYCHRAIKIAEENNVKDDFLYNIAANIYLNTEDYDKALEYYGIALDIHEKSGASIHEMVTLQCIGIIMHEKGNYYKSIENHKKAIEIAKKEGYKKGLCFNSIYLADSYRKVGRYHEAVVLLGKALDISKEINKRNAQAFALGKTGLVYLDSAQQLQGTVRDLVMDKAISNLDASIHLFKEIGQKKELLDFLYGLEEAYTENGDYKNAFLTYQQATALKDSIFSAENQKKIANLQAKRDLEVKEKENLLLQQNNEIQMLELEKKNQSLALLNNQQELQELELKRRNSELALMQRDQEVKDLELKKKEAEAEKKSKEIDLLTKDKEYRAMVEKSLIGAGIFLFLILLILFIFFRRKSKDNKLLTEKNQIIDEEREKSDLLLNNILPLPVANRLKGGEKLIADHYNEASIVFIDIVEFTKMSSDIPPEKTVDILNYIFTKFDKLCEIHGLEKIKTIGDCYMAVSGLPEPREDHAFAAAQFAVAALNTVQQEERPDSDKSVNVRIGIDSGPVVAGVIGEKKFIYDLWGDAVNTASRMEEYGIPGQIHVTRRFKEKVTGSNGEFKFIERGEVEIKGKGTMRTWLLKTNNFSETEINQKYT